MDRRRLLKKIAFPILLVGALLIGSKLFQSKSKLASVTIHYVLGDTAPRVKELIATVQSDKDHEIVGTIDTTLIGAEVVETDRMKPGTYRAEITLVAPDGTRTHVTKQLEVPEGGGTITVNLGRN